MPHAARSSSCSGACTANHSRGGPRVIAGGRCHQLKRSLASKPPTGFPTMDSQQLVDSASQNSQDIVLPKPASSTPRHSIDAILGLASHKRSHQEMEDPSRDTQENTGTNFTPSYYRHLTLFLHTFPPDDASLRCPKMIPLVRLLDDVSTRFRLFYGVPMSLRWSDTGSAAPFLRYYYFIGENIRRTGK